jgi:hypothetical protein
MPIGRYRLRLSVLDGDRVLGAIDLPHTIVAVSNAWIMVVSEEPRARFGDAIELRAADVSRRGNWLNLWLHWHALRASRVDTKYFVHLLDAQGNVRGAGRWPSCQIHAPQFGMASRRNDQRSDRNAVVELAAGRISHCGGTDESRHG